ncbi:hypothetical protein SNE40_015424 [Patella caerulea]|uniref:Small integral membrane protein 4 n=1 Tax=Patella caerulea TaxID=87958 RepID=A0AAN8PER4_PATCE
MVFSKTILYIVEKWPGKAFGVYRFLPGFFVLGAALEFSMVNWRVGETNFYKVYKRRKARELAEGEVAEQQKSVKHKI